MKELQIRFSIKGEADVRPDSEEHYKRNLFCCLKIKIVT